MYCDGDLTITLEMISPITGNNKSEIERDCAAWRRIVYTSF